jgi:hypothetical protein
MSFEQARVNRGQSAASPLTASGSRRHVCCDFDDIGVKVGHGNHAAGWVSEERKTLFPSLARHSLPSTASISLTYKQTFARYPSICLSRPGHCCVSFPAPTSIGRHFCRRFAEVPTFSTRSKCAPFHLPSISPPSPHSRNLNIPLTLPEQQIWLNPPSRPAFGHLKGTTRTTAPTASDRVISQIASIRKNKDILNSKPPPSLGFSSGS